VLSVVDAYTRECLALEVDTSLASRRVSRVLEQANLGTKIRCREPILGDLHSLVFVSLKNSFDLPAVVLTSGKTLRSGSLLIMGARRASL